MLMLFITIVGAILCVASVITPYWFGMFVVMSVVLEIVGGILYFRLDRLSFFYHDILGWHVPDNSPRHFDGCSVSCICKHCGKDILQDSQGNWF